MAACEAFLKKDPYNAFVLTQLARAAYETAFPGAEPDAFAALGYDAANLLMEAVRYESYEMPPDGQLSDDQIAALSRWIDSGAPWPGAEGARKMPVQHDLDWDRFIRMFVERVARPVPSR